MEPELLNLFTELPASAGREVVTTLARSGNARVERIVSNGEASLEGYWYDSAESEWVMLARGTAELLLEGGEVIGMTGGDYLVIEPHVRHRVERVSQDAVWVAVYY